MALRQKTVIFAFPTYTSTSTDSTVTNLTQITVYIPEAVRGFVSVFVDLGLQDVITATGGTITEHRCGLRLGAAGYTTITETDDITNSGEKVAGVVGPFDFTQHFTANWTGTSMTCDVQFYTAQSSGTTTGMRNVTAMLYVTYLYDDDPSVNATQIKTAIVPLESLTGALTTTSNSNIGSNQIPQLTSSGLLPEASVTIRDWYIVIEGNEGVNNATTDWTLNCNIDSGGSPFAFGVQEAALASDVFCRWIYKPSVPSTTAAHQFQMWCTSAGRLNHGCITLYVTYEFNAASTTRTLVTALLPLELSTPVGITTTLDASRFRRDFLIEDPGTITLRQSAFRMHFNTTAAVAGLAWYAGSQASRAYTHVGNVVCGMYCLQQRIDAGGAQGAGISIARGRNSIVVNGFATDTTDQGTNVSGLVILNYEADVGPEGIGQNTHSVFQVVRQWDAAVADRKRTPWKFEIAEAHYWVVAVGFQLYLWTQTAGMGISVDVEIFASEGKGGGYAELYADCYQGDNERACTLVWMRARDVYKRCPDDLDDQRIAIEVERDFRTYCTTTSAVGAFGMVTYHSFTYEVAADFNGTEAGDGSGVIVEVFMSDDGSKVAETVSEVGGSFSALVYDNAVAHFCTAREDGTHVGRSDNDTPVAIAAPAVDVAARMGELPSPLVLLLRSTATLSESGGVVTSWADSGPNGYSTTLAGTVGPDYESDALGDGSGYGMEVAVTDIGSGTTGRGGLRVNSVDFTSDAARRNFTAFATFRVDTFTSAGGCIIGFGAANYSIYEVNSGDLRYFYGSAEVSVTLPLVIGIAYRLVVVSNTTANGGTQIFLNGKLVLSGVQAPAGLTMTDICFGSNNNTGSGLYSLRGKIVNCGAFGQAFNAEQVGRLDKLMAYERWG